MNNESNYSRSPMKRYIHNSRFDKLTDDQLKELFKLRLSNTRFDGTIIRLDVVLRTNANKENEPFAVRFEFTTKQYGWEEQNLIFRMFFIDEWDYIHECLEELNVCPVSEYVLRKKGQITDLECSNRGWEHAHNSLEERVKALVESIK